VTRVVVVGGGITGLATAWLLRHGVDPDAPPATPPDVTVLEASDRLGGKLHSAPFDGRTLDIGADAFLARRPEALRLARRLGLGDDLVAPRSGQVWLWVGGRLAPLPTDTVFGVPTDARALVRSGAVGARAIARTIAEPFLPPAPPADGDRSVAEVVEDRLGREVLDVLVEPLLGGVYAGSVDRLSVSATTPMIAEAARHPDGLVAGLRAYRRRVAGSDAPVFLTVDGGLGRLVERLVDGLPDDSVRSGATVTGLRDVEIQRGVTGWVVELADGSSLTADHVVVTTPAFAAAPLLRPVAPATAELLDGVDYASVAVVTLAYDRAATADVPDGSGMLVPRTEGRRVKAATWSSGKWPHLADHDRFLVRASVGRIDDDAPLALDDDALVAAVDAEVREAMGITAPAAASRVTRWDRALPQYDVGHLDRVRAIRGGLPDRLHLAGAAYDGVGIAPCVAQAEHVARTIADGS
jgi:oxygen-dependent protoporphyrinogen oxidase